MKRILLTAVLILLIINSCKKEKEGLARFVIGNWKSQELTIDSQSEGQPAPVGCYSISFKADDTYVLTFEGIDCGADRYSVNGNEISLGKFRYDPLWDSPMEPATFNVNWVDGETQMTWTDFPGQIDIIWTKQ
ncbi:MAG TPA: hypothetical protein PLV06_08365 [Bacteroidales bacterium]|nr:hypothetical protein [Bacteroidales bacterium]HPF01687.1 hypothetical protein [Bacteroidales bacterium]HPJ58696.1 hypothetical protein [Bacteroidales bacterium]HPR12383.1 hypothetical protein [Bacteroidales bacterium]HRW84603.1 hypothetical protein [Bacteroidales bacterium]